MWSLVVYLSFVLQGCLFRGFGAWCAEVLLDFRIDESFGFSEVFEVMAVKEITLPPGQLSCLRAVSCGLLRNVGACTVGVGQSRFSTGWSCRVFTVGVSRDQWGGVGARILAFGEASREGFLHAGNFVEFLLGGAECLFYSISPP